MDHRLEEYAARMDIRRFGAVMPKRMQHIASGSEEPPRLDYAPNLTAKALHPEEQHLKVSSVLSHPDGTKSFTLVPDIQSGTQKLAYFRAGQYLSVKLDIGDSTVTRPYTISSSPAESEKGFYRVTVKPSQSGFAGNWICDNWHEGKAISTSAPLGEFYYVSLRDRPHVVGVCGGSGITPFISMAKAIAEGVENFDLTLLIGSRERAGILFFDELRALEASCDKLHFKYVLSDEQAEGFLYGFITKELIEANAPTDGDYSLFICGPRAMYEFLEKETASLGLAKGRVRREASGVNDPVGEDGWDASKADKVYSLTVKMRDSEYSVPCSARETLLVAMERAGLTPPSHCRSGECGFCRSHLLSGEVFIPERCDFRRLADREYGFVHPCCTFPLGDVVLSVASEQGEIAQRPFGAAGARPPHDD